MKIEATAASFFSRNDDLDGGSALAAVQAHDESPLEGLSGLAVRLLTDDSAHISTVVVTHFDADHWKGLPEYPKLWAKAPSEITFYYPYLLPGDRGIVQMAYMVLQAARADMPVTAALDIVTAWEEKDVGV